MIEFLDHIDKQWLLALNNDYPDLWDGIMYGFSEKMTWFPLYLSIIYLAFKKWKNKGWWVVLSFVLCIVIADQIASGIIKNVVMRPRPSHDPAIESMVCLVKNARGGMYGFVSSHAANSFGLAMLSSLLFRNWRYTIPIFLWAAINSYSRIYLGLHYPFDILGGALVGVVSALMIFGLLRKFMPSLFTADAKVSEIQMFLPCWTFVLTGVALIAYSIWWF